LATNEEVAKAYEHVNAFSEGFATNAQAAFADENAPTDPMIVVKTFERLIDTPAGKRPLRTIAGMDFGVQAINDAMEPFRIGVLESFQITDWDGVKA